MVVIVNDRMPDRKLFPPLTDVLLDNLSYLSWGQTASEICLAMLVVMWICLCFAHKQRVVIMIRMFVMMGTLSSLRSLTIFITSLPCADVNIECDVYPNATIQNRLYRSYLVYSSMGVTVFGNQNCGDYFFSGHTITLTLFNLFIISYTPKTMKILHTMSWCLNISGMYFLLAGRCHYSIDVAISFYITFQLFNNYHILTDFRITPYKERQYSWLIFPLFNVFESFTDGPVQNIWYHC